MELQFRELCLSNIQGLLYEAESNNSFLPYKSKPNQTISLLMSMFAEIEGFKIYGFTDNKGEVCSFIVLLTDGNSLDIGPMYVREDLRGLGLGKTQVHKAINNYKPSVVNARTWSGNLASQKIFAEFGFEIVELIEDDRINGDSTLFYRCKL